MEIGCYSFAVGSAIEKALSLFRGYLLEKRVTLPISSRKLLDFSFNVCNLLKMGQVLGRRRHRQADISRQLQLQLEEKERMNTLLAGDLNSLNIMSTRLRKELEEFETEQLKSEKNLIRQLEISKREEMKSKDQFFHKENEWRLKFSRNENYFMEEMDRKQQELDAAKAELSAVKQELKEKTATELELKEKIAAATEGSRLLPIIEEAKQDREKFKKLHIGDAGYSAAFAVATRSEELKKSSESLDGAKQPRLKRALSLPPATFSRDEGIIPASSTYTIVSGPKSDTFDQPAIAQSKSFMSWIAHDIEKIIDEDEQGFYEELEEEEEAKISYEEIDACTFTTEDGAKNYMRCLVYRHQKEVLAVSMEKDVISYRYEWLKKQMLYLGERHGLMMASKKILELESIIDDHQQHNDYLERQNWYLERENQGLKQQVQHSAQGKCEVHGILE